MQPDRRVVLIAGGSGALGKAVVPAFIESESLLFVVDRHPSEMRGRLSIRADATDD